MVSVARGRRLASLLSCAGFAASAALPAQTTWIVDAAGGPGVHFADLPSAVAAAASGDTILVFTGPNGEGAASFTTDKGLTILGVGGQVPIEPEPWPAVATFTVAGVPAGSSFRMAGFQMWQPAHADIFVHQCLGSVHFEDIATFNLTLAFTDVMVTDSASVTLRDLYLTGGPAILIQSSTVSIVRCQVTGGINAADSVVDVVQATLGPGWNWTSITTSNTALRVAGNAAATLPATNPAWPVPAIFATGGSVAIDPAITVAGGGPLVAGPTTLTVQRVPASWLTADAVVGQTTTIVSTANPGSAVFQVLGFPGVLTDTPIGRLGIDPLQPFVFFAPVAVPAAAQVQLALAIPAGVPVGIGLATQSVVVDPAQLVLGASVAFVTR